jgi:hypothetical protein
MHKKIQGLNTNVLIIAVRELPKEEEIIFGNIYKQRHLSLI